MPAQGKDALVQLFIDTHNAQAPTSSGLGAKQTN